MKHPTDDELNDLHDDLLAAPERAAIEAHLAACAECGDRSVALGALLDRLHGVPREIAPPTGTWEDIRRRLDAPAARRERAVSRWILAAAAVLLVVASSAATLLITGSDAGEEDGFPPIAPSVAGEKALARFAELEAAYLRAAADLATALERDRRSIPPEVAERAERSLVVIDQAVRETRAALANDPDNLALAELTLAAHRRKLEFLQRVRQWSTES